MKWGTLYQVRMLEGSHFERSRLKTRFCPRTRCFSICEVEQKVRVEVQMACKKKSSSAQAEAKAPSPFKRTATGTACQEDPSPLKRLKMAIAKTEASVVDTTLDIKSSVSGQFVCGNVRVVFTDTIVL